MQRKNRTKTLGGILVLVFVLAFVWVTYTQARRAVVITDDLIWQISDPQVVDPGQTFETEAGTLTSGYIMEAAATAVEGDIMRDGVFRLTMSVFAPAKDLPGQEAGLWYVEGKWTLTRKNANPVTVKVRHNPDLITGNMKAELTFDPLAAPQNWSALAWLPMSPAAGRWAKGDGSLSLNSQFEGDLFLAVELWPEQQ